jgi:hypothetical protein
MGFLCSFCGQIDLNEPFVVSGCLHAYCKKCVDEQKIKSGGRCLGVNVSGNKCTQIISKDNFKNKCVCCSGSIAPEKWFGKCPYCSRFQFSYFL